MSALREITDASGGRTEVVGRSLDLDAATTAIADELSRQYLSRIHKSWPPGRALALHTG